MIYMESKLATSELFANLRETSDEIAKANNLRQSAKVLTPDDIETSLIQVKQLTNELNRASIRAFESGRTILLYNTVPSLSVSKGLPFMTFKSKDGSFLTYIFMDAHMRPRHGGGFTLNPATLRDLLLGGLISNKLKTNYSALNMNQDLQKILMEIYCKFFMRILYRRFALGAYKLENQVVQYYVNRFFLERVFLSNETPEAQKIIAMRHVTLLDEMRVAEVVEAYEQANITKLSELLKLISGAHAVLGTVGLGNFWAEWINTYYEPAAMAPDTIEYLIFMIMTIFEGNGIISTGAKDMVTETRNANRLRGELLKIVQ